MQLRERLGLEQIQAFLAVMRIGLRPALGGSCTNGVERTVVPQEYLSLARQGKGLLRWYVAKVIGRGRAQVTRPDVVEALVSPVRSSV